MPIYECKNCLPIKIPDEWTTDKKSDVADLVRKFGKLRAVQLFIPIEMNLENAKNISFHVSEEKGFCRCRTTITEYEGQCPKCKRLNLNW